ncbi:MAG: hypothetical protein RBR15_10085 [Sphaerochaeta sp.]|nr:hypothetical protein [Sphaerochaeta sp.]
MDCLPRLSYTIAIKHPYHAWVEVQYNNKWLAMEGHIVDRAYLVKLQAKFPDYIGSFYGYGGAPFQKHGQQMKRK